MKKLFTLLVLAVISTSMIMAQSQVISADQLNKQVTYDAKFEQMNKAEHMMTAKTITPQNNTLSGSALGVQAVSPIELGRASNAYTILRMEQNQVYANDALNMVAFIHRHDVTIYGGGTAENGKYRYDLSTDGGASFTNDIGVLNSTYTRPARYPNITGYNAAGNSNPFNSNLVWSGPSLATSWDGHVVGVSDVNLSGATSTETYAFNASRTLLPGGLQEGLPGEFWTVDLAYDGSAGLDTIYVYKGTWNSATSDVDWVRFAAIDPGHDKGFDGTATVVGPNIAFGPGGQNGYISWLGDLAGQGDGLYGLSPCFIRTTDGGATWGTPTEADMSTVSWVADTLQSFWITIDTINGDTLPAGTGNPTCGFDFDLTVDANGAAHCAVVVGNSPAGGGYSISSGLVKFLGDITWDGTTLDVNYIGSVLCFRGEFGTPDPGDGSLLTIDNAVQASRTEDGTKLFFSWVDSDTSLIGFGESNNIAPNVRYAGLDVTNDEQTPVVKLTDGDFVFDGVAYTPVMAPTVLTSGTNYHLPIVSLDMITNNQLEPCKFWYFGNDAGLSDDCFDAVSNLNLTAEGFIGIDDLSCFAIGIEEELAENGLQHTIFPNPTTNDATIRFELPSAAKVSYNVVSVMGKEVISGAEAPFTAGIHNIDLNTSNLASGMYFYNLTIGNQVYSNKLMINR